MVQCVRGLVQRVRGMVQCVMELMQCVRELVQRVMGLIQCHVLFQLRELGQPVLQMRRGDLYGLQGWPGDPVICTLTPDGVLTHR